MQPAPPTAEQWEVLKGHVGEGMKLLEENEVKNTKVLLAVQSHHERFDGSGYPEGLAGNQIEALAGVERVFAGEPPAHLVTRTQHPDRTVVRVGSAAFGGDETVPIGGPCAVEDREALIDTALGL